MSELSRRGVRVRVVTNSLSSTDVPVVHSGYAKYRKDLLRAGVELYEMKPQSGKTYRVDPHTGFWQRFFVGFMGLLPVESQL